MEPILNYRQFTYEDNLLLPATQPAHCCHQLCAMPHDTLTLS